MARLPVSRSGAWDVRILRFGLLAECFTMVHMYFAHLAWPDPSHYNMARELTLSGLSSCPSPSSSLCLHAYILKLSTVATRALSLRPSCHIHATCVLKLP